MDDDNSHEIKRCLLLIEKLDSVLHCRQNIHLSSMTNLDIILRSRNVTLPTNIHIVKAMVFPVAKYGCESWTKRRLSIGELVLLNCGMGEDS